MGYTVIAQWTVSQPPGNLGNLVLIRLLEHYNLSHLVRSSIHIRSFKASFDPSAQSQSSRHLSAISYSQPSAQGNNSSSVKDDTTYLFLENKGDSSESEPQPRDKYKILAVKPSAVPLALLQNLMNPFVMGLSKSAKSAASATATQSSLVPTPLPGQSLLITSFAFPPLSPPGPQMVVTVHSLPAPTASSIFLEIEHVGAEEDSDIMTEFIEGCLPENISGNLKVFKWDTSEGRRQDWQNGPERNRRVTYLLARCLREGGMI